MLYSSVYAERLLWTDCEESQVIVKQPQYTLFNYMSYNLYIFVLAVGVNY